MRKAWFLLLAAACAAAAQTPAPVEFVRDIKPLLENNCMDCHGPGSQTAFSTAEDLRNSGLIVPGDVQKSKLYQAVVTGAMPPGNRSEERRVGKECRSRW